MIRHFCSLSDSKYGLQALTMIRSIKNFNRGFKMHYLCMDEPIYKLMSQFRYENVELYRIPDIDSADLITYRVGNDYQHFCWCLASYFTYWLRSVKEIGDIMYMDADLYFFNDYAPIFEEIGQKSIGIITHRFPNDRERKVGKYNVGIIYFKNDETGTNCLLWWKNVVMNPENPYYKTHSTCGDQKYLELFEPLYGKGNIQVIDKIGHLAAWNIHDHTFDDDINNIYWKGVRQTLIFCHFSHFQADLSKDYYKTNYNGEWRPETVTGGKRIYDYYFEQVKRTNEIITNTYSENGRQ